MSIRLSCLLALTLPAAAAFCQAQPASPTIHVVTGTADQGPGSLRQALEDANRTPGPDRIVFGDADGPFATPRTIALSAPLPVVHGEVEIDGHIRRLLWKAYGATVSGQGNHRVFEVAPGGRLHLAGITIADGKARTGAGILNRGHLVLEGVTLLRNRASAAGGGVANRGGQAWLINSTASENQARRGGAVANLSGRLRVTNSTLYRNQAKVGAAVFSKGELTLANSILAGDDGGEQCRRRGALAAETTHNLITRHRGCGQPISQADPVLTAIGHYNGPAPVFPLGAGSPALNLGDNAAAVDAEGRPLVWDQRGNGDPRYVEGYTDLGAFEQQPQLASEFIVDSVEDTGLRGCSLAGGADCPLRAALELAAAAGRPVSIRFDGRVFAEPQTLRLATIPPGADQPLRLDGTGAAPVTILTASAPPPWQTLNGVRVVEISAISRYEQ